MGIPKGVVECTPVQEIETEIRNARKSVNRAKGVDGQRMSIQIYTTTAYAD